MSDRHAVVTPLATRVVPTRRYRSMPSLVMPDPGVPDRVLPPQPSINELFELRVAVDDTTEADAFTVRFQVYCEELGYEPRERFDDRCECDRADLRSVSVVAYYRPTGTPVGCYRLLLADPARVDEPFHLEEVCPQRQPGSIPESGDRRMGCAEISRFCIIAPFRRFTRAGAAQPPAGIDPERWEREAPRRSNLAALMWLSAAHLAVHLRLDCILALMEPRLRLLCRSIGFAFEPIGPAVEFRGQRVPYRIDRRALRALLQVPQTAELLAPVAAAWEAQASAHPLLANYLAPQAGPGNA